jgi:hypothetical protein
MRGIPQGRQYQPALVTALGGETAQLPVRSQHVDYIGTHAAESLDVQPLLGVPAIRITSDRFNGSGAVGRQRTNAGSWLTLAPARVGRRQPWRGAASGVFMVLTWVCMCVSFKKNVWSKFRYFKIAFSREVVGP